MAKSMLKKIFDTLHFSVEANTNISLDPRQCKELLEREAMWKRIRNQYVDEIKLLNTLLELERSDE